MTFQCLLLMYEPVKIQNLKPPAYLCVHNATDLYGVLQRSKSVLKSEMETSFEYYIALKHIHDCFCFVLFCFFYFEMHVKIV